MYKQSVAQMLYISDHTVQIIKVKLILYTIFQYLLSRTDCYYEWNKGF